MGLNPVQVTRSTDNWRRGYTPAMLLATILYDCYGHAPARWPEKL